MEIEKQRGISVATSVMGFNYGDYKINILDTPGHQGFAEDTYRTLTAVDSVIIVVDVAKGVEAQTRKLMEVCRMRKTPVIVFINKLDRDRADFNMAYNGLSALPGLKPVTLYMPIVEGENLIGVVDVMAGKALMFGENGAVSEALVPESLQDEAALLRDTTVENIAESDEELMEKYLEEGSLSPDELASGLRKGVLKGDLVPVVVGAALQNKGGRQLLDAIASLFPSPLERPALLGEDGAERAPDEAAPACCFVFKTIADPFAGQLNMVRVISGSLSGDASLKNMRTGETERMGNLLYLVGKTQTPCKDTLGPGAIVAVAKLKNTRTGDTLCDEKAPFIPALPDLPPQLITFALAPKEKGDEDKVYAAIQKLLDEDIMLKLARDEETSDILLSGMGQLHVEISVERARRRYKVEIQLKTPKVPYRETVRGKVQAQGRHKKQTGGRGQFGDCWIEMEGLPRGSGYVFEDAIVGGAIPRTYIPAIDKGIQESAARGFIAGYPVVDFKVRVYDGSYHNVDSSEMAFKVAGSLAFKKAMETLKPVLLEPIVLLSVSVPDEHMGDVIGDLNKRRGRVMGMNPTDNGEQIVEAEVPMAEMTTYAIDLRSMTQSRGSFTFHFVRYEDCPAAAQEKAIAEAKALAEAE